MLYALTLSLVFCAASCTRPQNNATVVPEAQTSKTLPAATAAPAIAQGPEAATGLLKGIGVMGDSFYDEYRGADDRGGSYASVTFNLVELLVKNRGWNLGPWGDWGEPRRTGYEYNWAHSGDTSADLIKNGQHLGVAQQVRDGKVTFVFMGIGANDFSPYYGTNYIDIYNGTMSDEQLQQKIQTAVDNVTLAVDTVLEAGPKGMAVTLFTQ